jgi:hypothetical protein
MAGGMPTEKGATEMASKISLTEMPATSGDIFTHGSPAGSTTMTSKWRTPSANMSPGTPTSAMPSSTPRRESPTAGGAPWNSAQVGSWS